MWYHTDVNERILSVHGTNEFVAREPETLQFWAAKSVIGLKINFFSDPSIAPVLKDFISEIYGLFHVCGHCSKAELVTQQGNCYALSKFVYTFFLNYNYLIIIILNQRTSAWQGYH